MEPNDILLAPIHADAIYPRRVHGQDAGVDLHVDRDTWLWPYIPTDLPSGWRIKVPDNHVGLVLPRSSTFKRMHVQVHTGVIDASYTGELSVLVRNLSLWPKKVKKGTRLAQLLVIPCLIRRPRAVPYRELPVTKRGEKGFGSTGFDK